jgi:CHRD domain
MRSILVAAILASSALAQVRYFSASLDGAQEVPANASAGQGFGIVRFDASTNAVQLFCYHSSLSAGAVAAHMHQGALGVNGGVVIGLASSSPNTWTGSGVLTPAQAVTLNAGGMYFNVHTTVFPGGEIRGQIVESRSTRYAGVLSGAHGCTSRTTGSSTRCRPRASRACSPRTSISRPPVRTARSSSR